MNDRISDGDWFLPKRFGYGSGWPIAWQGWALLGGYVALIFILAWLVAAGSLALEVFGLVMFVGTTLSFGDLCRRHTRGGWRWRWGKGSRND